MAASGSMTIAETKEDEVEKPPKTYKLVLKLSWKKIKEFFLSNNALDSHKKMKMERKAILYKISKGEPITETEREFLNSSFREMLNLLFQNLEKGLMSYLELEESDSLQLKSFKIRAAAEVISWIKNLDRRISRSLDDIFDSNLPESEMIERTKTILDNLKNELKPENFSEYSSTPEDTNQNGQNLVQQSDSDQGDKRDEGEGLWAYFADLFL